MNDKKIVIVILIRKVYEIDGIKIIDKVIVINNMVIKVNFKNIDGKWLIDDFKVIGDILIGEEK